MSSLTDLDTNLTLTCILERATLEHVGCLILFFFRLRRAKSPEKEPCLDRPYLVQIH